MFFNIEIKLICNFINKMDQCITRDSRTVKQCKTIRDKVNLRQLLNNSITEHKGSELGTTLQLQDLFNSSDLCNLPVQVC